MGINRNSKKLTNLSITAVKELNSQPKAYFIVQLGSDNDYLFMVSKKISSASKFSEPMKVKKILETLNP